MSPKFTCMVDLPTKNGGSFHSFLYVYQRLIIWKVITFMFQTTNQHIYTMNITIFNGYIHYFYGHFHNKPPGTHLFCPGARIQAPPFVGPAVGLRRGIVRAEDGGFTLARERTIHLGARGNMGGTWRNIGFNMVWLVVLTCFNHLEKYEFVRLDHHPNYWGK